MQPTHALVTDPPAHLFASRFLDRLRRQIHRALDTGVTLGTEDIHNYLAPVFEVETPSVAWLRAVLDSDPAVHAVGTDRWVGVAAVVDGRPFTTQSRPVAHRSADRLAGVDGGGTCLPAVDLGPVLLRFDHWDSIPVRPAVQAVPGSDVVATHSRRPWGLARRQGDDLVVSGVGLPAGLLAVTAGPEGLAITPTDIDRVRDEQFRRRLAGLMSVLLRDTSSARVGPDPVQVIMTVLALDPAGPRHPISSISALLAPFGLVAAGADARIPRR